MVEKNNNLFAKFEVDATPEEFSQEEINKKLIADKVPIQWGGILGGDPAKFKIEIPIENYTLRYRNYTVNDMSVITLKSDGAEGTSVNGELLFPNAGTYTLEVYYTG